MWAFNLGPPVCNSNNVGHLLLAFRRYPVLTQTLRSGRISHETLLFMNLEASPSRVGLFVR